MTKTHKPFLLLTLATPVLLVACKPAAIENQARPEFRFGRDALLSSVRSIAVDSEDTIYVLDNRAANIKVFDPRGRFLRSIGVKGQGPAELAAPISLEVDLGDRLIVYDLGNRKLVFWSAAGDLLQEIRTSKLPRLFSIHHLEHELFVGSVVTNSPTGTRTEEIIVIDGDMNIKASIAKLERAASERDIEIYPPGLSYDVLAGGRILWGNWLNERLFISDPRGRVLETVTLDFKPGRITKADKESIRRSRYADLEPDRRLVYPDRFPCYARFRSYGHRVYFETFERRDPSGHFHYVWDERTRTWERILLDPYPRVFLADGYLAVVEDADGNPELMKVRLAGPRGD